MLSIARNDLALNPKRSEHLRRTIYIHGNMHEIYFVWQIVLCIIEVKTSCNYGFQLTQVLGENWKCLKSLGSQKER